MRYLTEIETLRYKQALMAKRSSQTTEAQAMGYSRPHFCAMINGQVPVRPHVIAHVYDTIRTFLNRKAA